MKKIFIFWCTVVVIWCFINLNLFSGDFETIVKHQKTDFILSSLILIAGNYFIYKNNKKETSNKRFLFFKICSLYLL